MKKNSKGVGAQAWISKSVFWLIAAWRRNMGTDERKQRADAVRMPCNIPTAVISCRYK